MSRLQFPFTEGLAPPGVQALQNLFRQNARRKELDARAKAESGRIKTQSQRAIGGAIGGGVSQIAGALGQRAFNKQQQNQDDLDLFGLSTKDLDAQADAFYGQIQEGDRPDLLKDIGRGITINGQPVNPNARGITDIPERAFQAPLSKENFRTQYRQGLLQQQAQQQAAQKQAAKQRAQQQAMEQKVATEQRMAMLLPDPKLQYQPKIQENMALLFNEWTDLAGPRIWEMSAQEQESQKRTVEQELAQLRQVGTKKQEFNLDQHLGKYTKTIPGVGTYVTDPKDGSIKFHQERAKSSSKGDDNNEKAIQNAMKEAREYFEFNNLEPTPQDIARRAFESLESAASVDRAFRKAEAERKAVPGLKGLLSSPQQRSAQPLSAIDRSQLGALQSSISGGGPPTRPVRPAQAAPGQPPPVAQQQQQAPVHPALAKISPQNINQKAVEIIQQAGGTSSPIVIEELKRSGMNRAELKRSLRFGQIYISGGEAFVWDGKDFIPLEKPT